MSRDGCVFDSVIECSGIHNQFSFLLYRVVLGLGIDNQFSFFYIEWSLV